ncbi:Peptidyl-prolyl isomerase CWC27 [Lecanosticta acicola]|uniref:Peptidyl-prolyl isomerase CWC27 n=1 Tax=Lecanosticta acicola TaxID=111012 RepID=A0AAI9EE20_9PEZI|nr:Peptidyl-prolyl isomerase CWC27 [Lecanosticta acicola]
MSNLYNLEPQPTAKVILNTTAGDLTLELFAKQTPLASRNFLQHCLDGYYNNTIFHRLVPGFIIQGGDPTGTGSGGISALNEGEPFQDEIHTRLKLNRRGLLGMANEGPDSNASQFFFTLDATPELQGKNTMFGRIEGDTIYNLMKMADAELNEGSERPMYPTKITGAEILVNPFEDMVARVKEAPRTRAEGGKKEVKKRKKPAGKNVLSFGGDEGEEDVAPVLKKVKANPKLVAVEPDEPEKAPKEKKEKKAPKLDDEPMPDIEVKVSKSSNSAPAKPEQLEEADEESSEDEEDIRQRRLDRTNAEIQALKASMKRTVDVKPKEKEKPKSALEAMIPETSTRGRKRGKATDEKGAFDLFASFKKRLEDLPEDEDTGTTSTKPAEASTNGHNAVEPTTAEDEEAALCDLHFIANCQSCKSWDQEANDTVDDDNGTSWMTKRLTFARDLLGKDLEWKKKMAEIEVIDPREKARELKEERKKGSKGEGKGRS